MGGPKLHDNSAECLFGVAQNIQMAYAGHGVMVYYDGQVCDPLAWSHGDCQKVIGGNVYEGGCQHVDACNERVGYSPAKWEVGDTEPSCKDEACDVQCCINIPTPYQRSCSVTDPDDNSIRTGECLYGFECTTQGYELIQNQNSECDGYGKSTCGPMGCCVNSGLQSLYHLKLDCDHKWMSSGTGTSARVCAKFFTRTDYYHEDCRQEPDSCPEFHIHIPDTESLLYISVYTKGEEPEGALLVDSWELKKDGEFVRTWWGDDDGARCISNQFDHVCWPILGAEYPVKGVNLYMTQAIALESDPTIVGDTSSILYENGHGCQVKYQCLSNICAGGICDNIVPTTRSVYTSLYLFCCSTFLSHTVHIHFCFSAPYHLKLDCDHVQASSGTLTSAQVCANFTLRDNESQTDHYHEDCHQETDSCPEFHIPIPDTEMFVSVDVYTKGEDPLLVDGMQLFDDYGELFLSWSAEDGEAQCLSDDCYNSCWSTISGVVYPVLGIQLLADGGSSNILYEDGHCCDNNDSQCESNECHEYECGLPLSVSITILCVMSYCINDDHGELV